MSDLTNSIQSSQEFEHLYRKAFFKKILGTLKNHKNRLLPLNEIKEIVGTGEEHQVGVKTVDINKIVGSENRFEDFDRSFLPLKKSSRSKWMSISNFYNQHQNLPVISLYKIGDFYFVRDGHHRVSVAKNTGQLFIDAEVIEIDIPKSQLPAASPDNYFLQLEEQMFQSKTGLNSIKVSLPGGYREILRLIKCFQCSECPNNLSIREKCQERIPWNIAVQEWYLNCYSRAIGEIQKSGVMEKFKNRTPADLYLWFLYNAEALRKASCFIPNRKSPTMIRKKPQSFFYTKDI